jgi:hypothetical protein
LEITVAETLFVAALAALLAALFAWAFRTLPREDWQVLATVPGGKETSGRWRGTNYTYYGVFQANACVLGLALALVMLQVVAVPATAALAMAAATFAVCLPATSLIAWLVEKQRHTLTVGGASFVGFVLAPMMVLAINAAWGSAAGFTIPMTPTLAAVCTCYALGEGVGRLACISFGCCYGKPLATCGPLIRRLFGGWAFVFTGSTKKAAYEAGLEGVPLLPIQAVTSLVLTVTGLVGLGLFLAAHYLAALGATALATQLWRFVSEFLRADFRNARRLSVYQVMALALPPYLLAIGWWNTGTAVERRDLVEALGALWTPATLLALQALWAAVFVYTGRSRVTAATIELHLGKPATES